MTKHTYLDNLGPTANPENLQLQTACRIALRYTHRLPTAKELQNDFGMHRATAYRWIAALKAVQGELKGSAHIDRKAAA